jgi:Ulp1 family protease
LRAQEENAYYNFTLWTIGSKPENQMPQQKNAIDCSVFICAMAEILARDSTEKFSQENCPILRSRIFYEIINKKLLKN